MKSFNFYETINDAEISSNSINFFSNIVAIKCTRKYFYKCDGEEKYIDECKLENSNDELLFELKDPDYDWDESNGINLHLSLEITNVKYLFGECGLVYDDSKLGIGLEWKPEKSRIKKCVKLGSFSKDSTNLFFTKDIELLDLTSNINFSLIIYVEKEGKIGGLDTFANRMGLVIGRFEYFTLKFGGVASTFPVSEINKPGEPLWKVSLNYSDIYEDDFSEENLKIIINRAHKAYSYLQENNKDYNSLFLSEVISSAVSTLLSQIVLNEDNIDFNKACGDGSIAQALKYFKDTLNFKITNNYFEIYESVKKYFDKEFK